MSNNGRLQVVPSIFTVIEKDGKYLLLRRANTGYMDGWYDLPAGHLEDREKFKAGAVRELKEEANIDAHPKDLSLLHFHQNHTNEPPHYGYIFLARKWQGQPKIMEPGKCDDMGWFGLNELPEKTLPYTKKALENLRDFKEPSTSYHGPGTIKNI